MSMKLPKDTRKKVEKAGTGKGVNMAAITPASPVKKGLLGWAEADVVKFTVTTPPTDNNLFLNVAGRGRVKSPTYRKWCAANEKAVSALPALRAFPVAIHVTVYGGKGWRMNSDIHNRVKAIPDLMVACKILPDDRVDYVHEVKVKYLPGKKGENSFASVVVFPIG